MSSVYYAHSKLTYNTKLEADDLALLRSICGKVIDPNKDLGEQKGIQPYLDAVKSCNTLVLRCYQFPFIGKGAFCEVCWALAYGKLCKTFNESGQLVSLFGVVLNDGKDWKIKYGRIM